MEGDRQPPPEGARERAAHDDRAVDAYRRGGETDADRLDRNWNELLQELRVTQTGVQILTGFLLAMPLQSRFADIDDFARRVYVVAVSLAVLATGLLVAPVSIHRVFFQRHRKETLVMVGDRLAKTGLAVLALAVSSATTLIFAVVLGRTAGLLAGAVTLLVLAGLWAVVPLALRGRPPG